MNPEVHPAALDELTEATRFFDERDETLGDAFFACWRDAKAAILADPDRYPLAEDGPPGYRVRYYWIRRFKYRVLYLAQDETIYFLAVSQAGRRPGYWHDRLPQGSES
jgi:hypothetical protein